MQKSVSVVIDKSFLQSCSHVHLAEIVKKNRLLVTAELFHELLTSDIEELKSCFKKLVPFKQKIDLVDHIGTLLRVEIEKQMPVGSVSLYFLRGEINSNFNFQLNEEQINHCEDFKNDWEVKGAIDFEKIVLEIRNNFPGLRLRDVRQLKIVREIYGRLRNEELPSADKINEQWLIFKRLQVDLAAAIEYLQSFKNENFNISNERKQHNQIDFRICILALLTRGLAANDKLIRRYFNYFCPKGHLFELNEEGDLLHRRRFGRFLLWDLTSVHKKTFGKSAQGFTANGAYFKSVSLCGREP